MKTLLKSLALLALAAAPALAASPAVTAAAEDIRDIRGPLPLAPFPPTWIYFAAGALVLLALYIWRVGRRRGEPVLSADELARQRLKRARMIMLPTAAREFSVAVSEAIRTYVEQRFNLFATQKTTEEFLHDVLEDTTSPLAPWCASLENFLTQCDLAKFAKFQLTASQMETLVTGAEKFIDESTVAAKTKPTPQIATQLAGAAS